MKNPKRGCDLGPCILKRQRSKKAMRSFFFDLKTSLGARACVQVFAFKKRGVLRLRS